MTQVLMDVISKCLQARSISFADVCAASNIVYHGAPSAEMAGHGQVKVRRSLTAAARSRAFSYPALLHHNIPTGAGSGRRTA